MTTVHSDTTTGGAAPAVRGRCCAVEGVVELLREGDEPRGARPSAPDVVDLPVLRRRARRAYDQLCAARLDYDVALERAWAELTLIDRAVRHAGPSGT
jgi:hypothetical protein